MNLYYDAEFTGLVKDADLLSVGIVAENGVEFYAEITDFDTKYVNDWIQEHVIGNMFLKDNTSKIFNTMRAMLPGGRYVDLNTYSHHFKGTKAEVGIQLKKWLDQFDKDGGYKIVADVGHYDMVLLIDLLYGNALDAPVSMSTYHELNQDIAAYKGVGIAEAFDISREDIIENDPVAGNKHNSLYDAKVCKRIFNKIHQK